MVGASLNPTFNLLSGSTLIQLGEVEEDFVDL